MYKRIDDNTFVLDTDNNDLEEKIRVAAETQRGQPEIVMLNAQRIIQDVGGSNVLANALEHVGDLSHRAQKQNAIGNVNEKVKMMLQYWSPRSWPLEKEIKEGTIDNCIYRYFVETGKYDDISNLSPEDKYRKWNDARKSPEVEARIKDANKETDRVLKMYVDAHEMYNQPITKLGLLGKQAAIALGRLEYAKLHLILLEMKEWVTKYNSLDEDGKWKMFSELI